MAGSPAAPPDEALILPGPRLDLLNLGGQAAESLLWSERPRLPPMGSASWNLLLTNETSLEQFTQPKQSSCTRTTPFGAWAAFPTHTAEVSLSGLLVEHNPENPCPSPPQQKHCSDHTRSGGGWNARSPRASAFSLVSH